MTGNPDSFLDDFIAEVLLRYFRTASRRAFQVPRVDLERSRHILMEWWAIAAPVRTLVEYLNDNVHELQSILVAQRKLERDTIRGRLDARGTAALVLRTGQPTWSVCIEPSRTLESGPNQVLSWVLSRVSKLAPALREKTTADVAETLHVQKLLDGLERLLRFDPVRQMLEEMATPQRPGPRAMVEAARSRRRVYRLAATALSYLRAIEEGDAAALRDLFLDVVLGPKPRWQRFEIAVGLAAAEALSKATDQPFVIGQIQLSSSEPFTVIGQRALYWQSQTALYAKPAAEPSEVIEDDVISSLGLGEGGDRPDFVLIDKSMNRVVSIIEVKYFDDLESDGRGAVREAVHQLVRYARGYRSICDVPHLVGMSMTVVSRSDLRNLSGKKGDQPWVADQEATFQLRLTPWAAAVISADASQTCSA